MASRIRWPVEGLCWLTTWQLSTLSSRQIQLTRNHLLEWSHQIGLRFTPTKSVCQGILESFEEFTSPYTINGERQDVKSESRSVHFSTSGEKVSAVSAWDQTELSYTIFNERLTISSRALYAQYQINSCSQWHRHPMIGNGYYTTLVITLEDCKNGKKLRVEYLVILQ